MTAHHAAATASGATDEGQRAVTDPRRAGSVPRSPLQERLGRLFEETRRPDGQLWTGTYLAEELKARGQDVSRQYLGSLLTGERSEPRISLVEAIADVFELPVSYFTGDYLGRVTSDLLPVLVAMRDPRVADLLNREDLIEVAEALTEDALPAWVGYHPLVDVLATLRVPAVRSAVEDALAALTARRDREA